jgi:hypothetical protein
MESKWPFMLITFGLIFGLGLTISRLERSAVMNNWTTRRCELPVVMAGAFFKPADDPRSSGDFAKDNFDFCMKSFIDKFMTILMGPINTLLGKHMNLASSTSDGVNVIRNIAQKLYNTLLSFLDQYMRRFNASVFEMSRIMQFLQMAMRRANGMVMSMLYSGITLFRGMINTIQFIIKVVLIICGIMIAIIIILFFILFPFIPMILAVLGAIISTVLALVMVMSGDIANEAQSDKGGFCFASWMWIAVIDKDGNRIPKPISQVKIGDELADGCGKITAVIEMDGIDIPLYHLKGIMVSGSHLVKGEDGQWRSVSQDKRAVETRVESSVLYCFNTTTHMIPVYNDSKTDIIMFRDWEEIEDDDIEGQYEWNYIVLKMLNNFSNYNQWKDSLKITDTIPLLSPNTKIKTQVGFIPIESVFVGMKYVYDSNGEQHRVLGIVRGEVVGVDVEKMAATSKMWNTELYELKDGVWIKGKSSVIPGGDKVEGMTIITESGEFVIWDEEEGKERVIRDFTEVGYKTIHKTYPFVASRLRTTTQTV